jgi:signal transduction histidine kinase
MSQLGNSFSQGEQAHAIAGSDLADLTTAVLHELNNALNSVSLQLAVMEQKGAAAEWAPELNGIRREVSSAGAKARRLQQLCHVGQPTLEPVDANRLIGKIIETWPCQDPSLELRVAPAPNLPPVRATPQDLERLLTLLIQDAAASLKAGASRITVSTARTERGIEMRVTDTGSALPSETASGLFDPFAPGRKNGDNLRLCLCQVLVKRLQGDIHAENLLDGCVAVIVRLQAAT